MRWSVVALACLVAPSALALLQPFAPQRTHAAVSMRRPALIMRADERPGPVTPAKAQRNTLRGNLDRLGTALAVGVAGVIMRAPPAFAARKAAAPPPPVPVKIGGITKLSLGFAASGTFLLVSHLSTENENSEEKKRVAKEVKKMKDMAKEYTDIDGGVDADKDMLESLRKRMANSTATDEEGNAIEGSNEEGIVDEGDSDAPPTPPPTPPPPTGADGGGGSSALLERPEPTADPAPEPAPGASSAVRSPPRPCSPPHPPSSTHAAAHHSPPQTAHLLHTAPHCYCATLPKRSTD